MYILCVFKACLLIMGPGDPHINTPGNSSHINKPDHSPHINTPRLAPQLTAPINGLGLAEGGLRGRTLQETTHKGHWGPNYCFINFLLLLPPSTQSLYTQSFYL